MKKRFLALTLALTMAMGMTMTAFAAEEETKLTYPSEEVEEGSQDSTTKTGDVKVTYETTESYEVTIPADVTFEGTSLSSDGTVKAEKVLLKNDKVLNVKMKAASITSGEDAYTLLYEGSKILYTIKKGSVDVDNNTAVLTVKSGDGLEDEYTDGKASGEATLTFATTDDDIAMATKAGEHKDTLTFTVSVDDAE
jgi:cytochrome c-type biogenesis protein CcmE